MNRFGFRSAHPRNRRGGFGHRRRRDALAFPRRFGPGLLLVGMALAALPLTLSPSGQAAAQTATGLTPPETLHVYEGQGQVTVTLTGTIPTGQAGSIYASWSTEGTVTHTTAACAGGDDFRLALSNQITPQPAAGATDPTWTALTICDDMVHELPETFELQWASSGTPYDSSAANCNSTSSCTTTVIIVDNDANAAGEYVVPDSWPLKPSTLVQNDRFRLLIFTTNQANHRVTGISHYNTHVQTDVKNTGSDHIKFFGAAFQVVGSTSGVTARVNTNMWNSATSVWRDGSTSSNKMSGIQINWLNGAKIADSYADFCDDNWASIQTRYPSGETEGKIGEGSGPPNAGAATGSNDDCTSSSDPLGNTSGWVTGMQSNGGLNTRRRLNTPDFAQKRNFGMSPVFRVQPPTVSIALEDDGSLTRNAAGQGVFTEAASPIGFIVSRDKAQATTLTVCIKIEETGGDQIPASAEGVSTAIIPSNQTTLRQEIGIPANTDDNPNSVVTITLLPPSDSSCSQTGYLVHAADDRDAAFIEDNDATVVSLTSSDSMMTEQRAADTAVMTVTLSRQLGAGEKLVVPLTLVTTTGAALPDAAAPDFTVAITGTGVTRAGLTTTAPTVTFTGHATDTVQTATVTFTPTDRDDGDTTDETINVGLNAMALGMKAAMGTNLGGAGAPHSTNNAVALTIDDDESAVSFSSATYSASEGDAVTVTVNISPTRPTATTLSITSTRGSGQGFAGSGDFTQGPYSVTIPADTASADFTIATTEDTADEPNETFTIAFGTLPTSLVLGTTNSATVTINDDDVPAVTMTAVAGTITEGGTAQFRLNASPAPYQDTTINITVTDSGSFARSGQAGSRTVVIGTSGTATLSVTTTDDSTDEADGTIRAAVTSGTGYTGTPSATVAVTDDDVPVVTITAGASPVSEGTAATFTLTASPTPYQDIRVTVNVTQSGMYATSTAQRTVTIGTSGANTLSIATTDDSTDEANGSITATLAADGTGFVRSSTATARTATVAVTDDDVPAITMTAVAGAVTEGADARFTLTASPTPYQSITINVNVTQTGMYADSTAARTVTMTTSGTATLRISTTQDNTDEADGSITATVASGTGYTGTPTRTVMVNDDDVPVVSVTGGSAITEGGTATFNFNASPTPYQTITVNVDVADSGSFATAGQTGRKTVSITTSGTASHSVTTVDDNTVENVGAITVTVASGTGYTAGTTGRVTVNDNDARMVEFILPSGNPDYREGAGQPIEFSVAAESSHSLFLDYWMTWGYGTAVYGMDFRIERWRNNQWEPMGSCVSGLGTWLAPGEVSHRYRLIILNDNFEETREKIGIALSSQSSKVVLGLKDFVPEIPANDPGGAQEPRWWTARFRQETSTVNEDAGTIRVAIDFVQPVPCTPLRHTFMDIQFEGSATVGRDYTIPSEAKQRRDWRNTARRLPNNRRWYMVSAQSNPFTVPIKITDDNIDDDQETIVVKLLPGHLYDIGSPSTHTITIRNHDPDPDPDAEPGSDPEPGQDPDPQPTKPEQTAYVAPGGLVSNLRGYEAETQYGQAHVDRWRSALEGLCVEDFPGIDPMTAAQGRSNSETFMASRWDPVVTELDKAEAAGCPGYQRIKPLSSDPGVSIAGGSAVTEGGNATFTLTASPKPSVGISVKVDITQTGDYAVSTAQRTVSIGSNGAATLIIPTINDSTDEPNGSIKATIVSGSGYTGSGSATVAINDNDDALITTPAVSITGGNPVTEGKAATFTLTASPAPARALLVKVNISQSGNYAASTAQRMVLIGTGGTATLIIPTTNDSTDEPNGSIKATIVSGTGYTGSGSATVGVADDDVPVITISAGSAVTEGGSAVFTLTAGPKPAANLSVKVRVSQSGAYGVAAGEKTVTISPSGVATLTVATSGDDLDEDNGSVTATLVTGAGYTLSATRASASVAVADDDDPLPVGDFTLSIEDASGPEGREVVFRVTLSKAATHTVRVSWRSEFHATCRICAVPGREFWRMSGTLVFRPGETTKSDEVYLNQDDWKESPETFLVKLSNPQGATITRGEGVMTITDDD